MLAAPGEDDGRLTAAVQHSAASGAGLLGGLRPVLIDLGSPARVELPTRADALRLAETAAAHSSAPYRPPELWDPPRGGAVTEATDGACTVRIYPAGEAGAREGGRLGAPEGAARYGKGFAGTMS
jgi:hypothetical protein